MITVKGARVNAGKTQKEIASELGIHVQTYMKLEKHPEKFTIARAKEFVRCVGQDAGDIIFTKDLDPWLTRSVKEVKK